MHQFYVKPDTNQISVMTRKVRDELESDNLTLNQLIEATGFPKEQVYAALTRLEAKKEVRCQNKYWELVA